MCIKDPQMYLDFDSRQRNGQPGDDANDFPLHFDTTKFVSYTRAGMYVEYVVWPAVYLYKNGPIVKRGVAQGLNREPEANELPVEMTGEDSDDNGDIINADADQGYNADSSNNDIIQNEDEDAEVSDVSLCMDDIEQEIVDENAHNLNFPYLNERDDLVDADQGYNEDDPYINITQYKDEAYCTCDMAHETDEEHAQNLNSPDFKEHDELSDVEDDDVSSENTNHTSSDENDGYARLSHETNVSMEDENIRGQDEFDTEERIFGNDVKIEKGVYADSKEQTTELKANGNRPRLYKKKEKKK
ncbi:hypothetical protein CHS0354_024446 [Potamilus streckersoni]|uniref:Mitochondria-eating protein C-terminal domain-containing protein n=1 Tax=Potamilus streckersoni TaxID=2493646 RepID=A0AAE0RYE6_9BIVA|nr:hypothetical protein CHS0354_024446 [Potamilus streckersoni]